MARMNVSSSTEWEERFSYSCAVRVGNSISVVGTSEPYTQARFILLKIQHALEEAGARMEDVVRTRMYVVNIKDWEAIGRAHGEAFRDIRPAATMVEVKVLIAPKMLVEIEADALIQ
jgi:enamine deaminase RidA (YjgF/YER057c/UK114 family)